MADIVSPEKRSLMMAGIKGKDTKPEILVRKALYAAGFRFRLQDRTLPGRPDIVLPKYKAAIFIHGCFWHGHENCKLFRIPKSREEFWSKKIGGNVSRDKERLQELVNTGWRPLVIWECALRNADNTTETCRLMFDWIADENAPPSEIRGPINKTNNS